MSKITIQLNNGELDIDKVSGFGVNYSIDDIKDITKRNSAYSKSIILPGTKNNNLLLGTLFDVNADFTFFNPNIKTDAKIIVDSTIIIDGYLQLKSITKLNDTDLQSNQVQYNVVIFDSVVNLFAELGEKEISELDFSDYDHLYTKANIEASWSHTSDDVYGYPMMYKNSGIYKTNDFKPGIFHKAYLEKIAEVNQFSLGGTFMSNTDYEREIIPFNGDIPVISPSEYQRRLFRAGQSGASTDIYSKTLLGGLDNQNGATFLPSTSQSFTAFDDDTTSPNFDPNGHWNTATNTWTVDRNGSYNLVGDFYLEVDWSTIRPIGMISNGSPGIIINSPNHKMPNGVQIEISGTTSYDGTYTIQYIDANNFKVTGVTYVADEPGFYAWECWEATYTTNTIFPPGFENPAVINGNWKYRMTIDLIKNGSINIGTFGNSQIQVPRSGNPVLPPVIVPPSSTFNSGNNYTVNQTYPLNGARTGLQLLAGDTIEFKYKISDGSNSVNYLKYINTSTISVAKSVPVDVTVSIKQVQTSNPSNYSGVYNQTNSGAITDGDTIFINEYIPKKFKQKDIFTDLIKRYNLYIEVDPDNSRKLILNTRDAYYSSGDILDWTDKKDYSFKDKIELLADIQSREMLFTYKADSDDWNKNYTESVDGDIYGQKTIEFANEFTKGEKKVETPFSPTPLIYNELGNKKMIVPAIKAYDPKNNIRVLYYAGLTPTLGGNSWSFNWINGGVPTTSTFVEYPYAGHFNDPINPTLDLNFGDIPYAWYAELAQTTNNNLYQRYWSNYINQIAEGKLVTSKFYLTEVDIAYIKNNLNSKIFVKDSYYYINNIQDYDPTGNGLTVVKLLKVTDGIEFVPETSVVIGTDNPYELTLKSSVYGETGGTSGTGTGTGYTNDNVTNSQRTNFSGEDNYIGFNSDRTMTIGDNNRIGDGVDNSGVLGGDNNIIENEVSNSWVIGDNNRTITQDNEIWINGLHIINGVVQSSFNTIDGGEDILGPLFSTSLINYIDGGEDTLRDVNTENLENYIDGGETSI